MNRRSPSCDHPDCEARPDVVTPDGYVCHQHAPPVGEYLDVDEPEVDR